MHSASTEAGALNFLMVHIVVVIVFVMVPIEFVRPAPVPVRVHSCEIVIHLTAVLAMTGYVPINASTVCIQSTFTLTMFIIRPRDPGCSERQSAGQRAA